MESCCFRWFKRLTSKHITVIVTVATRAINSRKMATVTPIMSAISMRVVKSGVKEAVIIIVAVGFVVVFVVVAVDDESVNKYDIIFSGVVK